MAKQPADLSVEITGLTQDGLGIAQSESQSLRVRNALPGEVVVARILRRRKGLRFADGIEISQPSLQRRRSACTYFPRCGGCSLHHLSYDAQLRLKQQQVEDALLDSGVQAERWEDPYSSARLGYRRKARFGVRKLGDQVLVGFRESFSNRVAKIDHCEVLSPQLSAVLKPLKHCLAQLSIAEKIPQIEVAQGDEQCVLMLRHLAPLTPLDMQRLKDFESRYRVQILLQSKGYDTLISLQGQPPEAIGYALAEWGLYMTFMPQQFTQVNLLANQALIRQALSYLGDINGKRVLDLFCGIGNFSLPLARRGALVRGVEAAADAVDQARYNAHLNGLSASVQFDVADLYNPQEAQANLLGEAEVLLLDPPRSGAGALLDGWLSGFVGSEVVYVSCNPATFASDARVLASHGFRLVNVGIFDMFPHTAHVETMGYFRRDSAA